MNRLFTAKGSTGKRRICFPITSRAYYGRSQLLLKKLHGHPDLTLELMLGGSILLDKYSRHIAEDIEAGGFTISASLFNVIEGGNHVAMAKTACLTALEFTNGFHTLDPDVVVICGDRFEQLAIAMAAAYLNKTIAHIEGGDLSGSIDESVRHAITKLAHIHFVTNADAHRRVLAMGEDPAYVFNTGSLDVERAASVTSDISTAELNGFGVGSEVDVTRPFLVVIQHPVTTETDNRRHLETTFRALAGIDIPAVWFWPNPDAGTGEMAETLRHFREHHEAATERMRFITDVPVRSVHRAAETRVVRRRQFVGRHQGVFVSRHAGGRHRRPAAGPVERRERDARGIRRRRDPIRRRDAAGPRPFRVLRPLPSSPRKPVDRRRAGGRRALHAETLSRNPDADHRNRRYETIMTARTHLTIGTREIGPGTPCFVIAEAGINHNGDVDLAAELVDRAALAGADAIKFQTHFPEHEMLRGGATAAYVGESLFDLLTRTALSREAHYQLAERAARKGILFLSTPFSREAADFLDTLGVPAFKTGSGELTNLPLQRHIARKGKPMIVSTGMSTPEEIEATVGVLNAEGARFALMHCTSTYPTPLPHVQLGCIGWLQRKYGVPVGFSDHTLGSVMALAAVASGANLFEKHFTSSRSLPGPDQQGSMEPAELADLVAGIRAIEQAGGATKMIQPGEQDVRNMALHSVVSIRDIAAGATIAPDDVWAKRPGTGIPAGRLGDVIGRTAKQAIPKDSLIGWDQLI